jgi:hypothetical protein
MPNCPTCGALAAYLGGDWLCTNDAGCERAREGRPFEPEPCPCGWPVVLHCAGVCPLEVR